MKNSYEYKVQVMSGCLYMAIKLTVFIGAVVAIWQLIG